MYLIAAYKIDERRVCRLLQMHRSMFYYMRHGLDHQDLLRIRTRDLTAVRVPYGYKRLHALLRREGWKINPKHVYWTHTEEGFAVRLRSEGNG